MNKLPHRLPRHRLWLTGALILSAATGCSSVGPDYHRPDMSTILPKTFSTDHVTNKLIPAPSSHDHASGDGILSTEDWWRGFSDPALTYLVEQALGHNLELSSAKALIRQAREQTTITASANQPQLNNTNRLGRDQLSRNSENLANLPALDTSPKTLFSDYRSGFDASWEIDIAGHTARSNEAALARLIGIEQQRHVIALRIAAEIAGNVIDYRATQLRLHNAETSLNINRQLLQLLKLQQQAGLLSSSDMTAAQGTVFSTEASLAPLRAAAASSIAALAVLTTLSAEQVEAQLIPAITVTVAMSEESQATPIPLVTGTIQTGLPSELLQRRPDVMLAESQLAAASADIGIAIAEQYPRLTLIGNAGLDSIIPGKLTQQASQFWSLGPQLSIPILSGGRLKAQVRSKEAARDAAIANYRQAVLVALQDTEVALIRYQQEQQRLHQLNRAVQVQQQQCRFAKLRYELGDSNMAVLLDAQLQLAQLTDQEQLSQQAIANDQVALMKALGGGFATPLAN